MVTFKRCHLHKIFVMGVDNLSPMPINLNLLKLINYFI